MAAYDNAYSQFVGAAKVLLPLAALSLLSTLFLIARNDSGTTDIPFAEIEAIARDQRITAPSFAGIGRNGAVMSVRADEIRPVADTPDAFAATSLSAHVEMPAGREIEMSAEAGELDGSARVARLTGLARLSTSDGYSMETAGLEADLAAGTLRSLGPLEVRAPFGEVTAEHLTVGETADTMVFSGGVRLLYRPEP